MKHKVTFLPSGKTIEVHAGTTVLQAAQKARVPIRTRCGGKAACLMCKVQIEDNAKVSPISNIEKRKLPPGKGNSAERQRLACQANITGDVCVTIPEDPLKSVVQSLLAKQRDEEDLW